MSPTILSISLAAPKKRKSLNWNTQHRFRAEAAEGNLRSRSFLTAIPSPNIIFVEAETCREVSVLIHVDIMYCLDMTRISPHYSSFSSITYLGSVVDLILLPHTRVQF